MIVRNLYAALFTVYLILSTASLAFCHKIYVFAYEAGGNITVEGKFTNGRPTRDGKVEVVDIESKTLYATGTTDNEGIFTFPVPQKASEKKATMSVSVDLGEGHKGSWLLEPDDYVSESVQQDAAEVPMHTHSPSPQGSPSLPEIERVIKAVVAEELAPIKREMAQQANRKPDIQDILGGLGYILGIAGLAAYFSSKKKEKK